MKLFYFVLIFAAGAASSLQGLFNGYWQQRLDLKTILLVNASVVMTGALLYYAVVFLRDGTKVQWASMTPSVVVGGICGIAILAAMALVFPRIGALNAVTLFVAGQLAAALLIGTLGIMGTAQPLDGLKIVGTLLVGLGSYLVLK